MTIVAPRIGGIKLADGNELAADGQLAGTPSLFFDAVAVVLSKDAGEALAREAAAVDFVRDAFGHLKAIAFDTGGDALLTAARVGKDCGVKTVTDVAGFIAAAKTHQWDREAKVRTSPDAQRPAEHGESRPQARPRRRRRADRRERDKEPRRLDPTARARRQPPRRPFRSPGAPRRRGPSRAAPPRGRRSSRARRGS